MNRRFLNLWAVTVLGVAWLAGCNDDGVRTEPSAPVSTAAAAPTVSAASGHFGVPAVALRDGGHGWLWC